MRVNSLYQGGILRKKLSFPGHILKEKRELLGFSPSDITDHLSIPVDMIHTLESGDFSTGQGMSFATGFLRSYCNFLGIEAEMMIAALQKQCNSSTRFAVSLPRPTFRLPQIKLPNIAQYFPGELIAWASITLLILLSWFTYNTFSPDRTFSDEHKTNAAEIDLRVPTIRSDHDR